MYKILPILLFAYGLALTTEDIYDNSYALIIGINKYENVQKLDFAADDAIAMKEILIKSFHFSEHNIKMLLNEEATKDNIIKEFSNVALKAQEEDRVIVFFAGHGETMGLPEGGQMGYLVPVNGNADNLYYSCIRMEELKSLALMSKAKHMLYLVDACYGGIATVGSRGLSINVPNYINKITSDKARQIITAGGKGEQVIEKSEWGHSAFTLNLKRGLKDGRADLNSDGYITANELGIFLSEKVTIDSENQQTPQFGRMTSQEGEFIFITNSDMKKNQVSEVISKIQTPIDYDLLAKKIANNNKSILYKKSENNKNLHYSIKITKLEARKQRNFIGFMSVFIGGIMIDALDEWGFEHPQLIIPAIGPMFVPSSEITGDEDDTPRSLLLLSTGLQTYFIWDYFQANQSLSQIEIK